MKKLLAKLILFILGWKVQNGIMKFREKHVILFAPHTSFSDGFIGKIFFWRLGIPCKFLMTKKYFTWYTTPFLRLFGFVPVGGTGKNAIIEACEILDSGKSVLICPEGHLRAVEKWNPGVYMIAQRAHVPMIFGYLDYKNKVGGVSALMEGKYDWEKVKETCRRVYKPEMAKYPEKFLLPK